MAVKTAMGIMDHSRLMLLSTLRLDSLTLRKLHLLNLKLAVIAKKIQKIPDVIQFVNTMNDYPVITPIVLLVPLITVKGVSMENACNVTMAIP